MSRKHANRSEKKQRRIKYDTSNPHVRLIQLPVMALAVAGLMAAGIILQLADRSRGSLKAGWLIHAGADLAINAIGAWLIFFG